ncbi:hypothetical protein [Methylophaga sp.]|jgi:hypothetical protein|uniref:hypothetical protein n=1 Tax=Methylophaga sp. TaxID=2024840 RepID=UPI0025CEF72A|nr:hypothetical protein [Methylophaga sp.]
MKYHRREFLKFGLVSLIGISFINTKAISFFNNIKMQKIGNNSYLIDGWVISKNDLKKRDFL